ncbi:MAG: hypothetical protein ACLQDV_25030 [Candidatus Binataceae bacterium]
MDLFWVAVWLVEAVFEFLWEHRIGVAVLLALFLLAGIANSIRAVANAISVLGRTLNSSPSEILAEKRLEVEGHVEATKIITAMAESIVKKREGP